jgi:uncharacterized protein (DUF427 family)
MRAIWNHKVIAESDETVVIEGNHYFPAAAVKMEYIRPGKTRTSCPWKGEATYYSIVVDGETNIDAAWYYPDPKEAAMNIRGRVAFWKGVEVKASD